MTRGWFYLAIAILAALIVFFGHRRARAHDAPSGWAYPQDCCSNTDCHPVSCDALREVDGGIQFLRFKFSGSMVRRSGDGFCHVCIGHYGPAPEHARPHCVFMAPRV